MRGSVSLLVLFLLVFLAATARADLEEFETWRFDLQDADDEYALDNLSLRFPHGWDEAWRDADSGVRLSNGCATHENWEMSTDVKLAHSLSDRFVFRYRFELVDRFTYQSMHNQFGIAYRSPGGFTAGLYYRPRFEKSAHDAGFLVAYEWSPQQRLGLEVGLEDLVNNRIAEKVGLFEQERWHYTRPPRFVELSGRLPRGPFALDFHLAHLARTEKEVSPPSHSPLPPYYRRILSGDRADISLSSTSAGSLAWLLELGGKRGEIDDAPLDGGEEISAESIRRREWWLRPSLDYHLNSRWGSVLLYEYRDKREENVTPSAPQGRYLYRSISRVYQAGFWWQALPELRLDFGFTRADVSLRPTEDPDWNIKAHRDPQRKEQRLFLVLATTIRGFRFRIEESFELDDESYDSFAYHDKTTIQVMAAF